MGASNRRSRAGSGRIKSKRLHLPWGFRVRPRTLFYFLSIAAVMGGFVVCAPLYFYWQDMKKTLPVAPIKPSASAPVSATPVTDGDQAVAHAAESTAEEPAELTLDLVLEKHRQASGLAGAQSVLLVGHYVEDGRTFEMRLAAKMPFNIRKTLSDPQVEIACVFDGQVARVEVKRGEEQVTQLLDDVLYRNAMMLEGSLLALGSHSAESNAQYHRGKDQAYEGSDCWTIVSQAPGAPVMSHLIDPETGFERARYLDLTLDGKPHQLSVHFSDYQAVGSFNFPHAYTLNIDGRTRGLATIVSVKFNPGLMPWMF